jgi:hypothetical protein
MEGVHMGLTMKEKQAVTRECTTRYQAATRKEKSVLLDTFTRLTGYHRTYAARLLRGNPVKEVPLYLDGEVVKLKPKKKEPANCKGKQVYTDEVITALRLVWAFFQHKCSRTRDPRILVPRMRQQMRRIAGWPVFHSTEELAEKLKTIRPASIDRYLKKDKAALKVKGKCLTKPLGSLKSRSPLRTGYTSEERKRCGFRQIDTVRLQSAPTVDRPLQATMSIG